MNKLSVLLCSLLTVSIFAEEIPIWKFFEPFELQQVQISPEGTYMAAALLYGEGEEQESKFQVVNRETNEIVQTFTMPDKKRVGGIIWIRDHQVTVSPLQKVPNEDAFYPTGELMLVDVNTGQTIDLPRSGIFNMLVDEPEHAMVVRLEGRYFELFKMHMQSGATVKISKAPALGAGFVLSSDLQRPIFHVGSNDEGETLVHERAPNGDWDLIEVAAMGEKGWVPTGPAFQPNEFFTRDTRDSSGIAGLGIFNTETRKHTLIFRDDTFDIGGVLRDQQGNAWGLDVNHHYPRVMYLNKTHPLAQHHKTLHRQFPEATIAFMSYSHDHNLVIASVLHANALPEIVLLDAKAGTIDQITTRANDFAIHQADLATVEPFAFKARDGLPLFGYLTSHKDTPRPGPTIVNIHGGPFNISDSYGWDGLNQLFASRGYHVVQINFRGSGGRGLDFVKSGWREYGGEMLDDVIDGTLWAIQVGIADKERVCVAGGSYGAYAAIMGAAAEPDLYQCVIGQSGIYDTAAVERIGDLARSVSSVKYLRLTMGRNREERQAVSAINFADKVKANVFLIHGGQDRRTPPQHYHRMTDAFESVGKPIQTFFKANQGHSWIGRDTVMDLYGRQLDFLSQHIGASGQTTSSAVSSAN